MFFEVLAQEGETLLSKFQSVKEKALLCESSPTQQITWREVIWGEGEKMSEDGYQPFQLPFLCCCMTHG